MNRRNSALAASAALLLAGSANAQQVDRAGRPLMQAAQELGNGEYVWAPELSPDGPALLVVNLAAQRAVLNAAPFGPLPREYGQKPFTIRAIFKPTN